MIQPIGKRVLVKRDEGADKTAAGIIMVNKDIKSLGTVLAVGDDPELRLKEGDRVILPQQGSLQFEWEGEHLEILLEDTIYAVIRD